MLPKPPKQGDNNGHIPEVEENMSLAGNGRFQNRRLMGSAAPYIVQIKTGMPTTTTR
jgi:hypothetical protein